jgi:formylglycine-generating enzyme required for sulfatase activity
VLPAAGALALYDPANPRWAGGSGTVAQALVTVNSLVLGPWLEALRPVRGQLTAPLAEIFRDKQRSETVHSLATDILTDYARDQPEILAELLMEADPKAFATLFRVAEQQSAKALRMLQAEIGPGRRTREKPADSEPLKDRRAERQARAAVALVRLGHADEVWPLLRHSSDPRLRSFVMNWLKPLGADPKAILRELDRLDSARRGSLDPAVLGTAGLPAATPPARRGSPGPAEQPTEALQSSNPRGDLRSPSRQSRETLPQRPLMDSILFHPETSIRRALILALGTFGAEALSPGERDPLIARLLELYEHDPDAGIHGAAEWTLRRWEQRAKVDEIDARLRGQDRGERRWYVNGQGQTFVLIEGPVEFRMGSPPTEPDRDPDEAPHRRTIPRRFAIAGKEVTVEQYQRFARENPQFDLPQDYLHKYSPEPDGPMIAVSWFGAAAYCNWLSQQEGLPKDQWCYLVNEPGPNDKGMTIPADILRRTGYRLPTAAESEYACRAGAMTSRYYGLSTELLPYYAWYQANSRDHAWTCGRLLPNDLGLFDTLGNVYEWCQERSGNYQTLGMGSSSHNITDISRLVRGGSFSYPPAGVRSAYRLSLAPTSRLIYHGFRLARTYYGTPARGVEEAVAFCGTVPLWSEWIAAGSGRVATRPPAR